MTMSTAAIAGLWNDFFDRDIERLLTGRIPDNDDLAELIPFVGVLAAMDGLSLDEETVEGLAALSALLVRESPVMSVPAERVREGLLLKARRRAATVMTGLMMVSGLTGVAMASDGAIPGDWNYGIDRALEAIGIGSGGAAERLAELEEITSGGDPVAADIGDTESSDQTDNGLENAAERVGAIVAGSEQSAEARLKVLGILDYLSGGGPVDGSVVSELAKANAGGNGQAGEEHGQAGEEHGQAGEQQEPTAGPNGQPTRNGRH